MLSFSQEFGVRRRAEVPSGGTRSDTKPGKQTRNNRGTYENNSRNVESYQTGHN